MEGASQVSGPSAPGHDPRETNERWPLPLRKLVQAHGEAAVMEKGLDQLGYPPTWTQSQREFVAVWRAFQTSAKGSV